MTAEGEGNDLLLSRVSGFCVVLEVYGDGCSRDTCGDKVI